jgi:hypothetical protein
MNIQEISQLTHASLDRLTSDAYKEAFNDPQTGAAFRARINEIGNSPRPAPTPRQNGRVRVEEAPAPTPAFDPSFDDQPASAPAAAAPAQPASQPVATTPGQLLVWEYQPTDAQNRPLGGVQRFKYDPTLPATDPKSLASQLTKSNIHVRRMANERKIEAIIDSVKTVATGYSEPTFLGDEWINTLADGRRVKFTNQELQDDWVFITAQVERNKIVYSIVLTDAKDLLSREEVESQFESELSKKSLKPN